MIVELVPPKDGTNAMEKRVLDNGHTVLASLASTKGGVLYGTDWVSNTVW